MMSKLLPILHELCEPRVPKFGPKSRALWKLYLHQLDNRCYWCGREVGKKTSTLDHIIPLSRGGLDAPWNLVLCCNRCNHVKDCQTVEEWLNTLETMTAMVRQYVYTETAATG